MSREDRKRRNSWIKINQNRMKMEEKIENEELQNERMKQPEQIGREKEKAEWTEQNKKKKMHSHTIQETEIISNSKNPKHNTPN